VGSRPNSSPLTPADAARLIVSHARPLPPEQRSLAAALGLVLATDVVSPLDLPPWANSAMDGYACRTADVRQDTVLRVVETVVAGQFPTRALGPGDATRLFTGAPLPTGADCVIRQEDTTREGDRVTIHDARDAGKNTRRAGEDVRQGETVLRAGTALGPAQLALLASVAHEPVAVHRPPVVAYLASGDELATLERRDDILAGRRVANSNAYALDGLIRASGAVPRYLGLAADTGDSLREHLGPAADADVLVTTAGVSVGEHDLVRGVLGELGYEILISRVRLRPGAPLGFGLRQGRPWVGLPGNPVSTMVTFELFVRPLIRRMLGHPLPFRRTVPVVTAEDITLGPRLQHFLRVVLTDAPGAVPRARLTGPQGSGILSSMARADALLIVPEDQPHVPVGTTLSALVLDDPVHAREPGF
jgi:molybdopterin molybdotransferase